VFSKDREKIYSKNNKKICSIGIHRAIFRGLIEISLHFFDFSTKNEGIEKRRDAFGVHI
jgi:hypothetical protein